jgi:steroid delta-isomerase
MSYLHTDARVQKIIHFYTHLRPENLEHLAGIYCEDAYFKDPFNEVNGLAAIRAIFTHMFSALEQPRFVVTKAIVEQNHACLIWEFHFSRKGLPTPFQINGSSFLQLASDGRIQNHRDYWDTGEELYNKIPLIGLLTRFMRRKLRTPL